MDLTLTAAAASLVPVIMILVSLSKTYVDSKWAPIISIGLGLIAAFFLVPTGNVVGNVIEGIVLGLSASGLYSGGKTILKS